MLACIKHRCLTVCEVFAVESDELSCRVNEVHDDAVVHQVVSLTVTSLVEVNPENSRRKSKKYRGVW